MRAALSFCFALIAFLAAGCAAEHIEDHPCPQDAQLTYDNFGKDFFARWCVHCHGGPNGYSSRAFTTVEAIRADRDRIFVNAADDNTSMPPGPDDPPEADRKKLADWLACGAP